MEITIAISIKYSKCGYWSFRDRLFYMLHFRPDKVVAIIIK